MKTQSTTIVTNEIATRSADSRQILQAISPMDLMGCGARDFVGLPDGIHFAVSRGKRKLVIKLQANDLFCVERVRMTRDFTCISEAVAHDVHVENLSGVVVELGDV